MNILITAYAVNPYKGSEDGTGWNIISEMAQEQNVIAITRRNNRSAIEAYRNETPGVARHTLHFHYYDLPAWLCWWKRGSRGALLYHYLWHLGVIFFILRQQFQFDVAHHLNFHSDWTPSFLWLLGKPFVWGPIGHHPRIPEGYLQGCSLQEKLLDKGRWHLKCLFWRLDPFLWICKHQASAIIGINSSVAQVLGLPAEKVHVLPAVAAKAPSKSAQPDMNAFHILSIGRFVPLKGFDMVIRSFATFFHSLSTAQQAQTRLTLIGKGPYRSQSKKQANSLNIPQEAIQWIDWISQEKLQQYYAEANVLFFPSHEGAGMVVPEAMAYGIPVLCYQNVGPGETTDDSCAIRIPYSSYEKSVVQFADALEQLSASSHLQKTLRTGARSRWYYHFRWPVKANRLNSVYRRLYEAPFVESKLINLSI